MRRYAVAILAILLGGPCWAASVDLSWTPPTHNTDGSELTDLAGYFVFSGCNQSGQYDRTTLVNDPTATGASIGGLPDATCYFAATAFNTAGTESDKSNEVSKPLIAAPGITVVEITWSEALMPSVYIAFQQADAPASAGKTWNSTLDPGTAGDIASLVDENNTATGWALDITAGSSEGSAGVNSAGSGAAAWVDEAVISRQYFFVNTETAIFQLNGLDNAKTYDFEWYGSRAGSGTRRVEISTDAFSTVAATLNCMGNNTNVATFSATPSSGAITIHWRKVSGDAFGYLNALKITEVSGGGTLFQQSVSGTLTTSGALIRGTQKSLAGTLISAGASVKETRKQFSGTLTPSGALSASLVFVQAVAGTFTSSGALVKQTIKALAGSLTSSGSVTKETQKVLAGALTSSGGTAKETQKQLAGTLTPSGALVAVIVFTQAVAGALTSAGALATEFIAGVVRRLYRRTLLLTKNLRRR